MKSLTAFMLILIFLAGCSGGGGASGTSKSPENQSSSASSLTQSDTASSVNDNSGPAEEKPAATGSSSSFSSSDQDIQGSSASSGVSSSSGNSLETAARGSSDPYYPFAWHLHTPQKAFATTFSIDPDANAHVVWTENNFGQGVTVAILDDYFDPNHPDIKSNVIKTYNAKTGGIDVSTPTFAVPHGQMCAGVVGANANSIGVIGVAPQVHLILIGQAYDSDAATIRAFEFARENGADVISCSWGSYNVSPAVADEIASIHDQNITIIFAAGNNNMDLDKAGINDESELPGVIGVSASNEYNDRTSYANYGSAVDIFAPGGEYIGIPTTSDFPVGDSTAYSNAYAQEYMEYGYTFFRGTSAAAPIVAGAAALLKAKDPSLTPDEIRDILIKGADKFGDVTYNSLGFERYHAFGKLNVAISLAIVPDK